MPNQTHTNSQVANIHREIVYDETRQASSHLNYDLDELRQNSQFKEDFTVPIAEVDHFYRSALKGNLFSDDKFQYHVVEKYTITDSVTGEKSTTFYADNINDNGFNSVEHFKTGDEAAIIHYNTHTPDLLI